MKIRTDFVTNSSSSSFMAFRVRSELLASVLEDKGVPDGFEVNKTMVSYEAGSDGDFEFDFDDYCFTPSCLEDVFKYIYYVIRYDEGIEYDSKEEPSSEAAKALKEIWEKEPHRAAESIDEVEWRSGFVESGEFYPDYDDEMEHPDKAMEIVMRVLGYTDINQVSEEEFCDVCNNSDGWLTECTYSFNRDKGTEEYRDKGWHFSNYQERED